MLCAKGGCAKSYAMPSVALQGYDVVSYYNFGLAEKGLSAFSHVRNAKVYRFSNAEHLQQFVANPFRYFPPFGSQCAFHLSKHQNKVADPNVFIVLAEQLYFFDSQESMNLWLRHARQNIEKAEQFWHSD
jgi:YHS domain-containing protein